MINPEDKPAAVVSFRQSLALKKRSDRVFAARAKHRLYMHLVERKAGDVAHRLFGEWLTEQEDEMGLEDE